MPGLTSIATISNITDDGKVFVDFKGNLEPPISVRVLAGALSSKNRDEFIGAEVLLIWPDKSSPKDYKDQPILLDVVVDRLTKTPCAIDSAATGPKVVHIDGDTLVLEGKREIQFRCGQASVTLQADGRIIIKGGDIVSRASRTHKVKGGSVEIN